MAMGKTAKSKRTARKKVVKAKDTPVVPPTVEAADGETKPIEGASPPVNGDDAQKAKKKNATAFILSFPESVKPKAIVEKGTAQGFDFDPSYAASVRSSHKKLGTWPTPTPRPAGANGARSAPKVDSETKFMRALNQVGVDRAKQLLALYIAAHDAG